MTIKDLLAKGRDLVSVDPQNLDREWLSQPENVYEVALLLADAKQQVAKKRAALELTEAKVAKAIRLDPAKYDVMKMTVDAVKEAVILSDAYQAASAELTEAYYVQNKLQALVDSLEHKKKSLEALGYLYSQNFYSAPQAKTSDPELDQVAARVKARKAAKIRDRE